MVGMGLKKTFPLIYSSYQVTSISDTFFQLWQTLKNEQYTWLLWVTVDDMSFDAPLKEPIQRYIDLLPNVKLIRHRKRSGLIVARMIGARLATAPVIIFLDAHTEVNVGWLEPLLDQLKRNRNQVIQPFIDGIDQKTLAFTSPGSYFKGAFSWDLRSVVVYSCYDVLPNVHGQKSQHQSPKGPKRTKMLTCRRLRICIQWHR